MKRVVGGKLYDVEKAEALASASWGYSGDFEAFSETLYKTSNGRFFLAGEGGPKTKYGEPAPGGGTGGGSDIIPLTEERAAAWCERHDEIDVLEEHLPDFVEEA